MLAEQCCLTILKMQMEMHRLAGRNGEHVVPTSHPACEAEASAIGGENFMPEIGTAKDDNGSDLRNHINERPVRSLLDLRVKPELAAVGFIPIFVEIRDN